MPRVTTGNTIAPCVVIGERAGEVLRATHKIYEISNTDIARTALPNFNELEGYSFEGFLNIKTKQPN
jgi:hypothetical protein